MASPDVLRLVLSDTVALRIVRLAASADVLRLVLSDTVALRIVRLAASPDVLRLVLLDTVALRIVRLAASADVLRLVLSDTVALRIVRIPADRLSSRPQVAFCAWSRTFLSVAIWQHFCKRQLESTLQIEMLPFAFFSPQFVLRTRAQIDHSPAFIHYAFDAFALVCPAH